jgi:hypothetical protein
MGDGYGSEYHLHRYLTTHRAQLAESVGSAVGIEPSKVKWRTSPRTRSGAARESRGLEFLDPVEHRAVRAEWRRFWPTSGRQPTWDAIGSADGRWLLVEAKANHPEFTSPPTGAGPESKKQIERALNQVKKELHVHRYCPWVGTYYQYANRLAVLWFLRQRDVDAHLAFIYFTGDVFPDGTPCPSSEREWKRLIEARRLTLGLPRRHALSPFEHHVFLPTQPSSQRETPADRRPSPSRFTRSALESGGFVGFVTFEALRSRIEDVPVEGGVYIVLRPSSRPPSFLTSNPGGRFKRRDPTVESARLQEKWVEGCEVLYIGKGDNLRRRLRQYADFGAGRPIGHWGGRYIWQLADSAKLLVAWKRSEPPETPRMMEARLLQKFKTEHGGRLPFANIADRSG